MLQQMSAHSAQARRAFERLDQHVSLAFAHVVGWRGWKFLGMPSVAPEAKRQFLLRLEQSLVIAHAETDAAAFRAIGQLAKSEQVSIHELLRYRAINDGFGLCASPLSPDAEPPDPETFDTAGSSALFVTVAVCDRICETEDPAAYLGAEYVSRQLVGLLRQLSDSLDLPRRVPQIDKAAQAEHACPSDFYRETILRTLTQKPALEPSILRGAVLVSSVFPLMLWDEVFTRTVLAADDIAA